MAFIIDDIAVVAQVSEAAEAISSAEAVNSVDTISEITTSADMNEASTLSDAEIQMSDLNDVNGVDDLPSLGENEVSLDIPNDANVFFDEYPGDIHPESTEAVDSTNTHTFEAEQQSTTYEELCEKRDSGGSYGQIKSEGWGWKDQPAREVHHMPADSSSNLERQDGPAIAMDYEDHQKTASCGSSRDAKEYRAEQHKLIEEGKFREALQMDIDDLHDKFGEKYNDAISQMLKYVDRLEEEGKI
ncbi:MAG: hypothetical protein ACRCZY_11610 [Phocaeicola sp.]